MTLLTDAGNLDPISRLGAAHAESAADQLLLMRAASTVFGSIPVAILYSLFLESCVSGLPPAR
jgi:hypothetical protein